MGKVVSAKMIPPDLDKSQKRVIHSSHRKKQNSTSLTGFIKVPGAQQPLCELIMIM